MSRQRPPMPLLELTDVHARYGQVHALHGVSLTVDEGEVVALLGANGAGKTTTLRAISGVVDTQGALTFDGALLPRKAEATARRGITHVPEGRGILGELTVLENLKMGAYLRRDRKAAARDLDELTTELAWLGERRDQQAGTLSGGEQQMMVIGRALMSKPRLLLLDEPSLGLAPIVETEIFRLVRRIHEEEGVSILLVEQNAQKALSLARTAYILEVGRVAIAGEAAALRNDERVRAAYLGGARLGR